MHNYRQLTSDLYYVGASDRKLALFENVYPIPRGVSYNSYLLLDEKTVLLDTADATVSGQFFENVAAALDGRPLDYLVVNHMEPDHCALIEDIVLRYPSVTVVTNSKAAAMIRQFFSFDIDSRLQTVAEGGTLMVTVSHTCGYSVSVSKDASEWIIPLTTKGPEKDEVGFEVLLNPESTPREGSVTFSSELGEKTVKVTVQ